MEVLLVDSTVASAQTSEGWPHSEKEVEGEVREILAGVMVRTSVGGRNSGRRSPHCESRRRRTCSDSIKQSCSGRELSAAYNAFEGAPCAPGDNITLWAQDERRRQLRFPIPREVIEHRPEVTCIGPRLVPWFPGGPRGARLG